MDIGFTEEQELLRDSARRFLEGECTTQFVRQRMAEPAAVTDEFWRKLAEQGWLGIVYPEEDGGSGLGLVDLVVLMEEMGRAVMPGPFLSTVLLGGAAIAEAGSPAQRREWLPRIAEGKAKAALAWLQSRRSLLLTLPPPRDAALSLPAEAERGRGERPSASYPLGRPNTRSPMMLRWISLVAPAIVYCRAPSTRWCQRAASGTASVGASTVA